MSINLYLRQIRKYQPLTRQQEKELFTKLRNNDREAYETIIKSNLRFVVSVAKKYQNHGLGLEELIQEGNLGLIKATKKFDPDRGFKFITYAVWWIRQSILTAFHEHSRLIKLPLNKVSNVNKLSKVTDQLTQTNLRIPTLEEIEDYIDDPRALKDLRYNFVEIEIDKPQTENGQNLNNIIPNEDYNIQTLIEDMETELEDILKDFPEREQTIIYMYFGIKYPRAFTLKEIGYEMNLTRERIRQIKEKVLDKLKKKKRSEKLRGYIE